MKYPLVMVIPDPGNRAQCSDNDSDVGNRPEDEDHVGVDIMMPEVVHDLENEPACTGQRTAAVNAAEMLRRRYEIRSHSRRTGRNYLKNRRATKPPP